MNIVIIQNNIYLATYVCKIVALGLFSFRVYFLLTPRTASASRGFSGQ